MTDHLNVDTLAGLVEGLLTEHDAAQAREHLFACRSCMAAYADAIRYRAAWLAEPAVFQPDRDTIRVARAADQPEGLTIPIQARRGWKVAGLVLAGALSALAVVVVLVPRNSSPTLGFELPPAVLEVSQGTSGRGLVLPGAQQHADHVGSELRSGTARWTPELDREVTAAVEAYDRGKRGAELGARVVAALLAAGEIENAREYARESLHAHPDAVPLLVFAADVCYRSNDLAEAESHLRRAAARAPRDPIVALDLGIVLRQSGRGEEARALFGRVARCGVPALAARATRELSGRS